MKIDTPPPPYSLDLEIGNEQPIDTTNRFKMCLRKGFFKIKEMITFQPIVLPFSIFFSILAAIPTIFLYLYHTSWNYPLRTVHIVLSILILSPLWYLLSFMNILLIFTRFDGRFLFFHFYAFGVDLLVAYVYCFIIQSKYGGKGQSFI